MPLLNDPAVTGIVLALIDTASRLGENLTSMEQILMSKLSISGILIALTATAFGFWRPAGLITGSAITTVDAGNISTLYALDGMRRLVWWNDILSTAHSKK